MNSPKRVLLLNGSHNEERLIKALKELGCYVITTGNRPELDGHKLADEYVFGDNSNPEAIYELATRMNVDAICPACSDCSVVSAAYAAEKMGLPGHDSYEASVALHHKDKFAEFAFGLGGIHIPSSIAFTDIHQALKWAEETEHEYPLIVKPVDLDGGAGIQRVDSRPELQEQIHCAFEKSRVKHIVVESFIEGTLYAFCTFLVNQRVTAVCSDIN